MKRRMTRKLELKVALMAKWGFTGRTIVQTLVEHGDEHFCVSTIYKYAKANGASSADYRRGLSPQAQQLISKLYKQRIQVNKTFKKRAKVLEDIIL